MKILLVKPYSIFKERNITYPLGLMYLSSYLKYKRDSRDEIKIYDMRLHCFSGRAESDLEKLLVEFRPDMVGVSSLTTEHKKMLEVARLSKEILREVVVVAGGPHPTAYSRETLMCEYIDYIVRGEGEETLCELIEAIEGRIPIDRVKGIGFKNGTEMIITADRDYIDDLDSIPYPTWDLIEMDGYWGFRSMSSLGARRYMAMFTSRGCPYGCKYCHNIFGKQFRARSVTNIIGEIEYLIEHYNIKDFEILDDIFNWDRHRMTSFLKTIIDRKMNIVLSFPNGLRTDLLDEDMLILMKQAGVRYVCFAIESASSRIQKLVNKNVDLGKVRRLIDVAFNLKMNVCGFFMLGFPTETKREMLKTIDFARQLRLPHALFFILVPYKGTLLYEEINPFGQDVLNKRYCHFFFSSINLSAVSSGTLFFIHKMAYILFYFSFRRMYYLLRTLPYSSKILVPNAINLFRKVFLGR